MSVNTIVREAAQVKSSPNRSSLQKHSFSRLIELRDTWRGMRPVPRIVLNRLETEIAVRIEAGEVDLCDYYEDEISMADRAWHASQNGSWHATDEQAPDDCFDSDDDDQEIETYFRARGGRNSPDRVSDEDQPWYSGGGRDWRWDRG